MTFDARTQTDYGTLRSYIRAGWNQSTPGLVGAGTTPCNNGAANNCLAYWDRAFIQFAGFTVGRGQSFFDLFTYGGAYTYLNVRTAGDTGAAGVDLWAYTVQFGNGVSYTLSLEDPAGARQVRHLRQHARRLLGVHGGLRTPTTASTSRAATTTASAFRTSSPTCASTRPGAISVSAPRSTTSAAPTTSRRQQRQQRPSAGQVRLGDRGRRPAQSGRRRHRRCQLRLDQGCARLRLQLRQLADLQQLQSVGVGWAHDGIFDYRHHDIELTEAWSINAAYQHIWGPAGTWGGKWRTTVYGGYVTVHYNDKATALINQGFAASWNACGVPVAGRTFTGWTPLAGNSCSPDFSFYQVGSRTQFNPAPLMDIGLDVVYTKLNSAYKGPGELGGERLRVRPAPTARSSRARPTTRACSRRSSAGSATSTRDRLITLLNLD